MASIGPQYVLSQAPHVGSNHNTTCLLLISIPTITAVEYLGDEDCLFLNIYTPSSADDLLPVMVYIRKLHYTALHRGRYPFKLKKTKTTSRWWRLWHRLSLIVRLHLHV